MCRKVFKRYKYPHIKIAPNLYDQVLSNLPRSKSIINLYKKQKLECLAFEFFWRRHPDLNWGMRLLQSLALPLGYDATWSERRGSNSLPPPWQGGALPDELRSHVLQPFCSVRELLYDSLPHLSTLFFKIFPGAFCPAFRRDSVLSFSCGGFPFDIGHAIIKAFHGIPRRFALYGFAAPAAAGRCLCCRQPPSLAGYSQRQMEGRICTYSTWAYGTRSLLCRAPL